MNDVGRLHNGLNIRCPKKKVNLINEKRIKSCITIFDEGKYTHVQFLRAVSHTVGLTQSLQLADVTNDSDDSAEELQILPTVNDSVSLFQSPPSTVTGLSEGNWCEVCMVAPRAGVALVPCGHAHFCVTCVDTVTGMSGSCLVCGTPTDSVMRIYIYMYTHT